MHFDRFDICEAWLLFFAHYHEGAGSEKYAHMSKLKNKYGVRFVEFEGLSENGKQIYHNLVLNNKRPPNAARRNMRNP